LSPTAVNAVDKARLTPLHCAVNSSALEIVRTLLRHGADPNAGDRDGLSPLHYAAAAARPPPFSHSGVVDLLIAGGAHVTVRDTQQRTPLHLAAAVGNSSLVRMLLTAGAEKDAVERILGETAVCINYCIYVQSDNKTNNTNLFYLGQLSHFPSCFGAGVTNLNEPPSS